MKAVRALRKFIRTAVFTWSPELSNTAKSPNSQRNSLVFLKYKAFWPQATKQNKTMISYPSHVESHGTGWPQWLPCQSQLKKKTLHRQPSHRQNYEYCLPQLSSLPAEELLVLETQREAAWLKFILRDEKVDLCLQTINCKYCAAHFKLTVFCVLSCGELPLFLCSGGISVHSNSSTAPCNKIHFLNEYYCTSLLKHPWIKFSKILHIYLVQRVWSTHNI